MMSSDESLVCPEQFLNCPLKKLRTDRGFRQQSGFRYSYLVTDFGEHSVMNHNLLIVHNNFM